MPRVKTFNGQPMTIVAAIRLFGGAGVTYSTFHKRYYERKWGFEESITRPNVGYGGGPYDLQAAKRRCADAQPVVQYDIDQRGYLDAHTP